MSKNENVKIWIVGKLIKIDSWLTMNIKIIKIINFHLFFTQITKKQENVRQI